MKKSFSTILLLLILVNLSVNAQALEQAATTQESKDPAVLLAEVRKDLLALKAEFIQYELTLDNEKLDMNSGTVWMQTPDRFRWQYKEPIEQLIVADGKQVWVYDEDLEQVTVKAQDNVKEKASTTRRAFISVYYFFNWTFILNALLYMGSNNN